MSISDKLNRSSISLGLCIALASSSLLAEDAVELDKVQVEGSSTNPYAESGAPYKAKLSGDERRLKDIAQTPATIDVLTEDMIKDSGDTDLRDILASQPSITLGTGEGGNSFGDRYIIRGHDAKGDVFIDGMKDPGMTTRESFATEQIEITKGPNSTFSGRGTTGGSINSITKQANLQQDFTKVEAGVGTAPYQRYTIDSNVRLGDSMAVRLNGLYGDQAVPERDNTSKKRLGFAAAGFMQMEDLGLDIKMDYYYLDAHDKEDLGAGIFKRDYSLGDYTNEADKKKIDEAPRVLVEDIPSLVQDDDFLDSKVNIFTLSGNFNIGDDLRVKNSFRLGTTGNGYILTGSKYVTYDVKKKEEKIILFNTNRWADVDYIANRLDLFYDHSLGDFDNQILFSMEYSDLKSKAGSYDLESTINPDHLYKYMRGDQERQAPYIKEGEYENLDKIITRVNKGKLADPPRIDYELQTISVSAMDVIDIGDLSVSGGIRYDNFAYSNGVLSWRTNEVTPYKYDDGFVNYQAGAVYGLGDGNVYANYSTSTNLNGGGLDTGSNCGYGGICGTAESVKDAKPEHANSFEVGTKWNLFDEKFLATAAYFMNTKSNVFENAGSDYEASGGIANTGKNRVSGVELSASGNITPALSTKVGATIAKSEILESKLHDRQGNSIADDIIGKPLSNFVNNSAFAQVKYSLPFGLSFGGTVTYKGSQHPGQPDSAASELITIPSYIVGDIFASYIVNEDLKVRANVKNVANSNYYLSSYRSGGFVYLGDKRSIKVSVAYTLQ